MEKVEVEDMEEVEGKGEGEGDVNGVVDGVLVPNVVGERDDDDTVISRGRGRGRGRRQGRGRGKGLGAGRGVFPPIPNSDPPNLVTDSEMVETDQETRRHAIVRAFDLSLLIPM